MHNLYQPEFGSLNIYLIYYVYNETRNLINACISDDCPYVYVITENTSSALPII